MKVFDLFKRKSREEEFQEAVASRNYSKIVEIGRQLLKQSKENFVVLNPVADALVKLGKGKEAVEILNRFADRKIKEGYYDTAIILLKKSMKIDPYNVETARLLSEVYTKKNLYYESFKVLEELFKKLKEAGKNTKKVGMMIKRFVDRNFHPYFYEAYGDMLSKLENYQEAFQSYILAGNMYANMGKFEETILPLIKARNIKRTHVIDRQIVKVASKIADISTIKNLLRQILMDNKEDMDFLKFFVKEFISSRKPDELEEIISSLRDPLLKMVLSALRDIEVDDIESAVTNIEKLKLLRPDISSELIGLLMAKHPDSSFLKVVEERVVEESLPSPSEILDSVFSAIDFKNEAEECRVDLENLKRSELSVAVNVEVSKVDEALKFLSLAEAMIGLENYKEALKNAEKAFELNPKNLKAALLISTIHSLMGNYSKGLDFLFGILKRGIFSKEDEARIKEAIGEIYERMGEEEKALHWYREANRVLNSPDISAKINRLK